METCSVVLTFESVDEILWCDHSNETSSAVLLHGTICFSIFYKMKHSWELKRVKHTYHVTSVLPDAVLAEPSLLHKDQI